MTAISITDLNNAKTDVDHIAEISTSVALTATDRLGHVKDTLAGAMYKVSAFNSRGAWVTATAYAIKDLVSNAGTWYVCVLAHTSSAAFATDTATKWRVYQGVTSGDLAASGGSAGVGFTQGVTGSIPRTVQDKARESVSVTDFYANGVSGAAVAGDGITDCTLGIQAALNNGGRIEIPFSSASYLTTNLVVSVAGTKLFGAGALKLKNASNISLLTVNANNVTIDGIEIDGNRANQTLNESSLTSVNGHGVQVSLGVTDLTVNGCYIHDTICNGISGSGNHARNRYTNNRIKNTNLQGIFPTVTSASPFSYGVISGNTISEIGLLPPVSGGGDGIGTVGMQYTTISNNVIKNCKFSCIALEAGNAHVSVTGNTIDGNVTATGIDGTGTVITDKPTTGIQMNDCWNISVVGNTVRNCAAGIVTGGGSNTKNLTIQGNNVSNCTNGIDLGSTNLFATPAITCVGNTISNSYGYPLRVLKIAYCTVADNLIEGVNLLNATATLYRAGIVVAQGAQFNTIHHNVIRKTSTGVDAATGYMDVGILEMSFGGGAAYQNTFTENTIISATYYPVIVNPVAIVASYPLTKVTLPLSVANAPTSGSWTQGQISWRANAASGSPSFDMCKTSGQFAAGQTGTATATQPATVISMSNTNGYFPGMAISIAGAGPAAAALSTTISAVDRIANTITILNATSTTIAGAVVSMVTPVFTNVGNLV